jgi:hypothetical protein
LQDNREMATAPASSPGAAAQVPAPSSAQASSSVAVVIPAAPAASAPTTIAITLTTPPQQPISLWDNGTVLVAGITFVGVVFTLVAAHHRMRCELRAAATEANVEREQSRARADLDRKHAALEAHKERLTTTRRLVYLEAVEAIGTAQMFLGGLGQQELDGLDYQGGMAPLLTAVSKVAVVGEMNTVKLARELSTMLNQRFLKAIVQLLPLGGHKSAVAFHRAKWEATQVEIKRILAAMDNHNQTQKNDPGGFDTLMHAFRTEQERAASHSAGEQKAHDLIAEAQLTYSRFVVDSGREVALHLDGLADAVRRELNIDTDLDAYRAQTTQMLASVDEAMEEMNAAIKKLQERGG